MDPYVIEMQNKLNVKEHECNTIIENSAIYIQALRYKILILEDKIKTMDEECRSVVDQAARHVDMVQRQNMVLQNQINMLNAMQVDSSMNHTLKLELDSVDEVTKYFVS